MKNFSLNSSLNHSQNHNSKNPLKNPLQYHLLQRYSRSIVLKDIGLEGQKKIIAGNVLIIGLGAIGSVTSCYLTMMGVGKIGLADYDTVELSNLQRQSLYNTFDIQKKKVTAAKEKLSILNPHVNFTCYDEKINQKNLKEIIQHYDLIIDATDSAHFKFALNDVCLQQKKNFIFSGIIQYQGQFLFVIPKKTPCLRCLFPHFKKEQSHINCAEMGIFSPIAGIIGSLQASETTQFLINQQKYIPPFLQFNLKPFQVKTLELQIRKGCICN